MSAEHLAPHLLQRVARGTRPSLRQQEHLDSCRDCRDGVALSRAMSALDEPAGSHPDAMDLVLLAEGRLASPSAAAAHVERCAECAADLEGLLRASGGDGSTSSSLAELWRSLAKLELPVHVALATRGAALPKDDLSEGLAAYRAKKHAVALEKLSRAAAEPKARPEAHYYLAACLIRAERFDDAAAQLEAAVKAKGAPAEYRWLLAQALLAAGRGDEARTHLEKLARSPGARRDAAREQLDAMKR